MNSKTIEFFKEISKIPRESGNEKEISNYIVSFAKERNLEYVQDEFNNVIVKKYCNNEEPIILQAHLDMVCEKEEDIEFDFQKDGIKLVFDDEFITAYKTTLGADNGIGVAQILNLLDNDLERNIEAIFTTNEETTMEGALKIDLSSLKGKTMINLDGFNADTILLESASFTDIDIVTKYDLTDISKSKLYKIVLSGLNGGHSGFDIDKKRGNAIILLANLLLRVKDLRISSFCGGSKINVIPSSAESIIETDKDVYSIIKTFQEKIGEEYKDLIIRVETIKEERLVLSESETNKFLKSITSFKHGIIYKNNRNEVITSQNLALVDLSKNLIQIGLRSSSEQGEEKSINYLEEYCGEHDYILSIIGYQPGFSTSEDSNLVKKAKKAYYKINNKYPSLKSVHISVEVGIIKEKIKDLEVIIISPNITEAHTPNEKVSIFSIKSCDQWLMEILND